MKKAAKIREKKEKKDGPTLINTEDAKKKEQKDAEAEESEEINYETPETNIADIIEEIT